MSKRIIERSRWEPRIWFGLLIVAVVFHVHLGMPGYHDSSFISERHGFRQAQTAVTVQEYFRTGAALDYKTPMTSPPWRCPYEFPFYQLAVYAVSSFGGLDFVLAARLVSLATYILAALALALLCVEAGAGFSGFLLSLTFCVLIPFYIFWARAFMIETTALALSVGCVYATAKMRCGSKVWLIVAMASGILAAMVKLPTFASAVVALSVFVLFPHSLFAEKVGRWFRGKAALVVIAATAAGLAWNIWTEHVRNLNPISKDLTSSRWAFGTLDLRLEPWTWRHIGNYYKLGFGSYESPAFFAFLAIVAVGLVFSRHRKWILLCLGMFVFPMVVFFRLYLEHDYYSSANLAYLLAAAALAITGLPGSPAWKSAKYALAVALISFVVFYSDSDLFAAPSEITRQTACFSRINKDLPEGPVAGVGFGLDPSIGFYLSRRVMLFRGGSVEDWLPFAASGPRPVAVVVYNGANEESRQKAREIADHFELGRFTPYPCGETVYMK